MQKNQILFWLSLLFIISGVTCLAGIKGAGITLLSFGIVMLASSLTEASKTNASK